MIVASVTLQFGASPQYGWRKKVEGRMHPDVKSMPNLNDLDNKSNTKETFSIENFIKPNANYHGCQSICAVCRLWSVLHEDLVVI